MQYDIFQLLNVFNKIHLFFDGAYACVRVDIEFHGRSQYTWGMFRARHCDRSAGD